MTAAKEKPDDCATLSGSIAVFVLNEIGHDKAEWLKEHWAEISAYMPLSIDFTVMVDDSIKGALKRLEVAP